MRRECIEAVSKAMGRQLNQVEAKDIEERITRNAKEMARADPAGWLGKSRAQRLAEAGKRAAAELVNEAHLKAEREALQISANARYAAYKADAAARGIDPLDAIDRKLAFSADQKSNLTSLESESKAIARDFLRELIPVMEATNPKWFGLLANMDGVRKVMKEIHGEDSGDPVAKAGAKIWHEVAEKARQRFNAAGGDVGKLEDWSMPHHHSQVRVARAGRDEWLQTLSGKTRVMAGLRDKPPPPNWARDRWVNDVLPLLKRDRYVNEDGTRMSDEQLGDFLREAWLSIASGGANKSTPGGVRGKSMRANRGNESRQIHFKDADSYIEYQKKYGEKSLEDVLTGHIENIAKDIAHVEEFGPNSDAAIKQHIEEAAQELKLANPAELGNIRKRAIKTENLYNEVAGKRQPVASERLAKGFDTVRNWLTGARLGGAAISSLSDEGTLHLTAHLNNLPEMKLLANQLATMNPANKMEKRTAMRAGLALNSYIASLNRFGQESLGADFSRKVANTVLRSSGLNAITEARRRAYGVTAMGALGSVAKEHADLNSLDAVDKRILKSKGVTQEHFAIWKKAELEDFGGGNDTMLTPDSIYRIPDEAIDKAVPRIGELKTDAAKDRARTQVRQQAATKLLAMVLEETDMAVIEPGARERAFMAAGRQRGTWKGELAKSFFLFKSFPLAMIMRHWSRAMAQPTRGGRAKYIAALVASTTVLGAMQMQLKEMLAGRDPRNLNPFKDHGVRNWIKAALQGGSLGIYGDFLFSESTQHGQSPVASFLGPVVGLGEDAFKLTQGNIMQASQGQDTHAGAEALRFLQQNTPGSNLWYAKAALDHLIFHRLAEYFSPGYLRKMRNRAEREFGQRYWWEPGEATPTRAPDLAATVGEQQ